MLTLVMLTLVSCLLMAMACIIAIPVTVFFIEIIAAVMLPRHIPVLPKRLHRRIAVLVPAHNESRGLLDTLDDIKSQLVSGDRLLVVADNCTDDTAAVANAAGAEVTERREPDKIGKGYALAWGLKYLSVDPPDIVIIIDADCRLEANALECLTAVCAATDRPVQALYLMTAPTGSLIDYRVAEFAWRVKNWMRPLGLRALNLPCQLMGTGMAFPWRVVGLAELATGRLVEDLALGLDLACSRKPPLFCPSARVNSQFALTVAGAESQRKRWEQGHIGMILTVAPRLICLSLAQRNWGLLILALDIAVPPVALLGIIVAVAFAITALATLFGVSSAVLLVSTVSIFEYAAAVLLAWSKFGRDLLPLGTIWLITFYVVGKLRIYRYILSKTKDVQWIRTDRGKSK